MKGSLPENNFVLLETNRFDKDNSRSYLFTNPTRIISCYNPEKLKEKLSRLDGWLSKGYYAAGFISYEAGYIFEEGLKKYMDLNPLYPLMWFGIYKDPIIFDHKDKIDVFTRGDSLYSVNNLRANVSQKEYIHNINRIKNFIRQGNTYQVNYTFKYKFDFSGSLYSFYQDLKEKQSVSYSALIKTQDHSILSLSPELFFKKNRKKIEVRPMKGTFNRGRDLAHDRLNMSALRDSLKDRSENVMIVDLLRNDLGRICKPGTV
ncbi:MAG: chorismate-binding protein, partial [Candidatus Omnitrophota bacterium]|nr:chorismate-binding protein [Candidatus Omnitrophota bacterium]